MRFPIVHFLPHFGIHFLVIIVQYDLHSLIFLGFTLQIYKEVGKLPRKKEEKIIAVIDYRKKSV